MAGFDSTRWRDIEFAQGYRNDAQIYLPYRKQFFAIAIASALHLPSGNEGLRVLDIGCGDGAFVQELLCASKAQKVVLVDGSDDMLASAQKRLAGSDGLEFIQATFQDLQQGDRLGEEKFDFIFSSLAIHHLTLVEKAETYRYVFRHLAAPGFFLNYDVVLAPTPESEAWAMTLWRMWIENLDQEEAARMWDVPEKYKTNSDNIPDTLDSQLALLTESGFEAVDCFLKYGPFALFGGQRPARSEVSGER